jgi:uncharacterized membrane protein
MAVKWLANAFEILHPRGLWLGFNGYGERFCRRRQGVSERPGTWRRMPARSWNPQRHHAVTTHHTYLCVASATGLYRKPGNFPIGRPPKARAQPATNLAAAYKVVDLGALPGVDNYSYASRVNNAGQVIGNSSPSASSTAAVAFIWDATNGLRDLGKITGDSSVVSEINNSGVAVGHVYPGGVHLETGPRNSRFGNLAGLPQ